MPRGLVFLASNGSTTISNPYVTHSNENAKVLLLDIETTPNLAWVWGKYEQDVIAFEKEWRVLSVAYKWLGEPGIYCRSTKDDRGDEHLIQTVRNLLDEADIVVAHNGDSFDIPKLNTRILYHGITPPSPFRTVDTKKLAKRYFKFNSNSLNDLGQYLGLGKKLPNAGFSLWKGCMDGDEKSWNQMIEYNIQDVDLLEKIYLTLRPWMSNHPNMVLLSTTELTGCAICGGKRLHKRGTALSKTTVRQRYQCQDCGGWGHVKFKSK